MSQICPFCRASVHDEAIVCQQCNAHRGVGRFNGVMLSKQDVKKKLMLFGIPFVFCLLYLVSSFLSFQSSREVGSKVMFIGCMIFGLFLFFPCVRLLGMSFRKEAWFR